MKPENLPRFSALPFPGLNDFATDERDILEPEAEAKTKSRHAITINRPPVEVVSLLTESPDIIYTLAGAEMRLDEHAAGMIFDLKVQMEEDGISFESNDDAEIKVSGKIQIAQGPDIESTVLTVSADYSLPGGKLQEWLKMFAGHDPDTVILVQMKRLKALIETGEIPTTVGQPSGREHESSKTIH